MLAAMTHAPQAGWEAGSAVPIWYGRRPRRPERGCESSSGRASRVVSDESGQKLG